MTEHRDAPDPAAGASVLAQRSWTHQMTALKLLVAATCLIITALRARDAARAWTSPPSPQRSSKVAVPLASLMLAIAVTLDVDAVTTTIDTALGADVSNLMLRAVTYALFLFLTAAIARGYQSLLALWLIRGRPGRIALITALALTATTWALGGASAGSTVPGLVYALTWQAYLGYLAVALLSCLLPVVATPGGYPVVRTSAAMIASACMIAISYIPARLGEELLGYPETVTNLLKMTTVLLLVAGTTTPWVVRHMPSFTRRSRPVR